MDNFQGDFFQVDINIRPAEQGCVWDQWWVCGGDKPPYGHLEYIADIVFTITIIFQLTIFSIYCSFLLCGHFAPAALNCVQALNIWINLL